MREKQGSLTVRNLIISYILLYTIMPIVTRLTSRYLTTYFYMAVVVALVIQIIVLDRSENLNVYGFFLLPFLIFEGMTRVFSHESILVWGYQVLLMLLPIIIGYWFMQDGLRVLPIYPKLIVFAFAVTMITTIVGCFRSPNAARILATVDSGDALSFSYDMQNIGGYRFIYYMVLLYPVLILSYKMKKIKALPTVILSAIIFVTVIYSEYTIALLMFILSSFLFLTKKHLTVNGIVVISVASLLFLLVFGGVVSNFLHWLGNAIGSEVISTRLDALAGGTAGLGAAEDNRVELYRISLNTFFSNPLFGRLFEGRRLDGGHSFIVDSLAQFGALGAVLMVFMYRNVYRRFFRPFKNKPGYGYVVWTFIQAVILSLVNTGMWMDVLCLFCPILFYKIYGTFDENEEMKDENTVDRQYAPWSAGRAS